MTTVATATAVRPLRALCASLGVAPATYYRARRRAPQPVRPAARRVSPRALSGEEQQRVLDVLHAERFIDLAPAQVYAMLLDEGLYHCSERTMCRVLAEAHAVRERRAQRRHSVYAAPELLATGHNQVWGRDITKRRGPSPGV